VYPVPATKNSFLLDNSNPAKFRLYTTLSNTTGLLGLAGVAAAVIL
jgi:hypothetical protein